MIFICRPEDKKSISSEDSKSTSSSSLLSLTSKSTDSSNSKSQSLGKSLLETEIKETVIEEPKDPIVVATVTNPGHMMSQSMFTDSSRLSEPRLSTKSDEGPRLNLGHGVELLKRQRSTPEKAESNSSSASDDITSMDTVLAEIMSDVRSLEMQQSSDKRMSLPLQKSKSASKHTPDLVLDLPEGSNSSSPQDGSDRDSPTLSAAETFAKSNQGTLKKASSMPRNVSGSEMYTAEFKKSEESVKAPGTVLSTFQGLKRDELMSTSVSSTGRKFSLEEHHLKSLSLPSTQTITPPITEKPKPPIKVKPPVMKKPTTTRSPDTSRRLETNQDTVTPKSGSPSTFK